MKLSPAARNALAAEYALGTLRGRARSRFEALMAGDRELRETVDRWNAAFMPLTERVAPQKPPARVWHTIEARLAPRASAASGWWRPFALVAGGVASVLLAFFIWTGGTVAPGSEPKFVAVLMAPDSAPRMVVSMHEPDMVKVRMVKPWKNPQGMGLELWALAKDGKPRSLGMVKNEMGETMIHVAANDPRMRDVVALAVSMEPMTGSPTGAPTGPVLCSGAIAPV